MPKQCPVCKATLDDDSKFCEHCGYDIEKYLKDCDARIANRKKIKKIVKSPVFYIIIAIIVICAIFIKLFSDYNDKICTATRTIVSESISLNSMAIETLDNWSNLDEYLQTRTLEKLTAEVNRKSAYRRIEADYEFIKTFSFLGAEKYELFSKLHDKYLFMYETIKNTDLDKTKYSETLQNIKGDIGTAYREIYYLIPEKYINFIDSNEVLNW